jgi:hypothetical protein
MGGMCHFLDIRMAGFSCCRVRVTVHHGCAHISACVSVLVCAGACVSFYCRHFETETPWSGTCYVAEAGLELVILLPHPLEC